MKDSRCGVVMHLHPTEPVKSKTAKPEWTGTKFRATEHLIPKEKTAYNDRCQVHRLSTMPRQRLLTAAEQQAFDRPPLFTAVQRKNFFALSEALRSLVYTLQTPTNRVYFLVTLAYFRATRRFFGRQMHEPDGPLTGKAAVDAF
jgi:hypothetical protein